MKMAERLLSALIEGSIDPVIVINGIQSGTFVDPSGNFIDLDNRGFLQEFVPCFLTFVKDKLSQNLASDHILSFSPKRHYVSSEERRNNMINFQANQQLRYGNKGKKLRPDESRVRSAENLMLKVKQHGVRSLSEKNPQSNVSCKPRSINLNSSQSGDSSNMSQLNLSFADHSTDCSPQTSTPQVMRQNPKRRITPTLVTPEKGMFHQKGETRRLFETSLVLETSDSSQDSSGSLSAMFPFDRKSRHLDKVKRGRKRNEIPLSAFLGNEERLREKKTEVESPNKVVEISDENVCKESSENGTDRKNGNDSSDKENLNVPLNEADVIETEDLIFMKKISDMVQMKSFIKIYACALMENLVSNILAELYFLHGVFNYNSKHHSTADTDEVIFDSIESCVYFTAKVLEETKHLSAVFDMATLSLISQNKRLQLLAPGLVEFVNNKLNDLSLQNRLSVSQLNFSSSLGVPFQVEGNNRKLFSSDRYFYSFSKMRDKFYGLLRKWEENHLKHDWSIENELGGKFQTFFFEFREFPVYSQFSQLFIAQLIEMSAQDFSGLLNKDEPQSSGLLEYLKSTNPSKFQRLQERFFSPMISQGPCPKSAFSDVEAFFKLFIDRSCNFYFQVHLRNNLISRILAINSIDFASQVGNDEGADDSEALYQIRSEYSLHVTEAKILAKFLGYVVFSPYETDDQSKHQCQDILRNDIITQPFNPNGILNESVNKGKLLVTIPWMVQYLSYMNETSLKLRVNRDAFTQLIHIYRLQGLRFKEANLNGMFILLQLGWLFEQPLISSHVPFYQLLENSPKCWNKELCDWTSSNGTAFISKSLLIRFCPYISEIKNVLSKAGSGSFRKIKPLTHIDKVPIVDSEKILRENMMQDFFKYKPKYFKETADFVIDRFCANLKLSINTTLVPGVLKDAMETLKESVFIDEGICLEIESLKQHNSALLKRTLSVSKPDLEGKIQCLCDEYCKERSQDVLAKLFPVDVDERVLHTAAKIVTYDVKQKMQEWISHKVNDQYEDDLNGAFHKLLMGEVKRCSKSLDRS